MNEIMSILPENLGNIVGWKMSTSLNEFEEDYGGAVFTTQWCQLSLEEVDDSIIAHNIRTFPIMLVKLAFYAPNNYRFDARKMIKG